MPQPTSEVAPLPVPETTERPVRWRGVAPVLVAVLAAVVFGHDLAGEPSFADEYAYLSQAYYAGLFASGRWNDPAWLEYPAYDLPPLPKYLIGAALWVGGYRSPGPAEMRAWYANIDLKVGQPGALTVARVPIAAVGVAGCLAVYGLGTLAAGRLVGLVATFLLMLNPLYRMQARRAMSDVPSEAFVLVALFFGLLTWKTLLSGRPARGAWAAVVSAGVSAGLALLSKLSGLLALMVLAAWSALAFVAPARWSRRLAVPAATLAASAVAVGTFVALDPYLMARPKPPLSSPVAPFAAMSPLERARYLFRLRFEVSAGQQKLFPHNALSGLGEKAATVAVQGFGRFGPFGPSHADSTRWLDPRQDWGAAVWLPWVAAGAVWAAAAGRAQRAAGVPPTAWALLLHFAVALGVVTLYLPMAWDRYQLPIQAPACLLAAAAAVAAAGRLRRRRPAPGSE
jgi:4-amino-4-deoxy-L-arabinose transferase-like glycosyltransferase